MRKKMFGRKMMLGALAATMLAGAMGTAANAQPWGPPPPPPGMGPGPGQWGPPPPQTNAWYSQHPGYLHAMADLRSAYWLLQHRGPSDPMQNDQENRAMAEIRFAYQELQHAAARDNKDIDDQPPADFQWGDHGGRMHKALALLQRAHNDVGHEEDNPAARGLRDRATVHIDNAGRLTAEAMQAWHF